MSQFKKGDYIVTLINDGNCGKTNFCSKQREDYDYLRPEIDTTGDRTNENNEFKASDTSNRKWRYATESEIEYYDTVANKPFDVTTIANKYIKGHWYKWIVDRPNVPEALLYFKYDYTKSNSHYYTDRWNVDKSSTIGNGNHHCLEFKRHTIEVTEKEVMDYIGKKIQSEPTFIVGKWYIWQKTGDRLFYLKCSGITATKFNYNEYIYVEENRHSYSTGSYSSFKDFKGEISTELIQKYLPADHSDKIKIPCKLDAFKLGDKVETPKGKGVVIAKQDGEHFLIEHLENIGGHMGEGQDLVWGNKGKQGYCWWYKPKNIILLNSVEPYTVGGYVRVTKASGLQVSGAIGKITRIVYDREIWTDLDYSKTEKAYFIKDAECEWIGMEKPVEYVKIPDIKPIGKGLGDLSSFTFTTKETDWSWSFPKPYNSPRVLESKELEFQQPVIIKKRSKSQLITI